jgi:hypothetical protein
MWNFTVKLHKLQEGTSMKAGNKLANKYIDYSNNRMNVKLAVQTLSRNVAKSLEFLTTLNDNTIQKDFNNCLPTARYCLQFNNMFDMLNCKNQFSKNEFNTAVVAPLATSIVLHIRLATITPRAVAAPEMQDCGICYRASSVSSARLTRR